METYRDVQVSRAGPVRVLVPDWPAPPWVGALTSTRLGGTSEAPFSSLNLATHVGDDRGRVEANRDRLQEALRLPAPPRWLTQVHGHEVVDLARAVDVPEADASVARTPGVVCAVLTADCLPVLLCDLQGTRVAAAHAGWRGLTAGVLEATVAALDVAPETILAWLGPAIGQSAYEVGDEVRGIFVASHGEAEAAFAASERGRWLADVYALARQRLALAGVTAVHGGGLCTHSDPTHYYSYRRDGVTGRMASLIWLAPP